MSLGAVDVYAEREEDGVVEEDFDLEPWPPRAAASPPPPSGTSRTAPKASREDALAERAAKAAENERRIEQTRRTAITSKVLRRMVPDVDSPRRPGRMKGRVPALAITWTGKAPATIGGVTLDGVPVTNPQVLHLWLDLEALPLDKALVARARALMRAQTPAGLPVTRPEIRAEMRAIGAETKARASAFEAECVTGFRDWIAEIPARQAAEAHGCPSCVPALRSPVWDRYEAARVAAGLPPTCPRSSVRRSPA